MQMNNEWDKYSKQQLMGAFSIEHASRKHLEKQLSTALKDNAAIRYDRDKFRDKYLRVHIEHNVEIVGDMQDTLDRYFSDPTAQAYFTPSGGYYCTIQQEECVLIVFAWHNPDMIKAEYKDMPDLIRHIAQLSAQPIRYTGAKNVMGNHSVQIEEGLWELNL